MLGKAADFIALQCTLPSYALLHINLIQANRNVFITNAFITAGPQFNVVTGGSG